MSRSARLLDLIQALRRHRPPVTAVRLAEEFGVSPRTIYRDIGTLVAQRGDAADALARIAAHGCSGRRRARLA